MTTMLEKDCVCALCGAMNQCFVLSSSNNFGGMDTEFRSYAVGTDPLSVYVETCSTCGYAAYDLSKEMPGHILPEVRKAVDQFYVSEGLNKTEVPTYKKYELSALLMEIRSSPSENVAETFLRAAWMADDANENSHAARYRKSAATLLEQALARDTGETNKSETLFRLAEIYRRSGDYQPALATFDKIDNSKLHPDLQKASAKLRQIAKNQDNSAIKFQELL